MSVHTTSAQFKTTPENLFEFISKIENLPKWATGYCKSVRKDGEDYIIETPAGEAYEVFEIDQTKGTVDMYCGQTKDNMWCWPARVTSDNMGGSVLAFTCIKMPGQADEVFNEQCEILKEEFENIRRIVE